MFLVLSKTCFKTHYFCGLTKVGHITEITSAINWRTNKFHFRTIQIQGERRLARLMDKRQKTVIKTITAFKNLKLLEAGIS